VLVNDYVVFTEAALPTSISSGSDS
jgi:hypothetical protein